MHAVTVFAVALLEVFLSFRSRISTSTDLNFGLIDSKPPYDVGIFNSVILSLF